MRSRLFSLALFLLAAPPAWAMEANYVKIVCDHGAKEFHLTRESADIADNSEIEKSRPFDGTRQVDIIADSKARPVAFVCAPLNIRGEATLGLNTGRGTMSGRVSLWHDGKKILDDALLFDELRDYQYEINLTAVHYNGEEWQITQCKKCNPSWDVICIEEKRNVTPAAAYKWLYSPYNKIFDDICDGPR